MAAMPKSGDSIMKWVILKDCFVKVNGSTNINKFTCTVADYSNADTLTYITSKNSNGTVIMNGHMALPVFNFDCVNKLMTKDLRKTLKEKEYPAFCIRFISMDKYPLLAPAPETIGGTVSIELAGVKKQLDISYKISMGENGIIQLAGTQIVHFSDFNLLPPRKLGGMVRTSNKLGIEFILRCRIIKS